MNILAVLSENTVQYPKTLFWCLLYIYTFPIASFRFFVQWIDLGSKNPLQLTHSGYQDTKIFGTKVFGGSMDFNVQPFTDLGGGGGGNKKVVTELSFKHITTKT